MSYTPETINSGDPITAEWGNKIEQELATIGNYMGKLDLVSDLPSSPQAGDFYLVMETAKFYLWTGSKWQTIGGSTVLGTAANKPNAEQLGRIFVSTDTHEIYADNGTQWIAIDGIGTPSNTANTTVKRDSNGNFSAGTITANLNGHATSATSATNATNASNADTVDHEHASDFTHAKNGAKNIWVQSTAPTSASVGDIWIDTST